MHTTAAIQEVSASITQHEAPPPEFSIRVKTCLLSHRETRTVSALARKLNLARNTVSIAINHPTMLPTVKQRIGQYFEIA